MTALQTPVPADFDAPPSRPAPGNTPPDAELVVFGTPAPQGSKSGFALKQGGVYTGRVAMKESSNKVKPWRAAVHAIAIAGKSEGWVPLDGPLAVEMVFTMRKPASAPKRRRTWPDRYPDVSKLIRSTEDALTSAGIWADDARVVEYRRAAKVYPLEGIDALDRPGAVIRVWRIGGAA